MSEFASVSDEAFAILSLENNFDTWMDMGIKSNTKTSTVPRKYTNGGNSQGQVATSQHNKGWSDQGLHRFNEIFDLVQENRGKAYAQEFEDEFRNWCKEKAEGNKRKKVAAFIQETIEVRHKLWSNNEDENVTPINDLSNNFGNKVSGEATGDINSEVDTSEDEDSEEEASCPDNDNPVFCEI